MSLKILVADDEANITDVCTRYLEREGYEVITAHNGEEALAKWASEQPHLIVLDLMMPQKTGWQVCEEIRHTQDVPIIMLTARGEEMDRLLGLTIGADDYLTKPFSPRELVLRVKSVLRRVQPSHTNLHHAHAKEILFAGKLLQFPGLEINEGTRCVAANGQSVELTVKEFDLLWLLASHPEQVFSRSQLLTRIWDTAYDGDTTTVTVHIRRLREKVELDPSNPKWIKTVWGIGYKFEGRVTS